MKQIKISDELYAKLLKEKEKIEKGKIKIRVTFDAIIGVKFK